MLFTENEIEMRAARAAELFQQGYNCAQSVAGAYADYYGMEMNSMLKIASSFGGGIGRMRETCGAACGMFILAGLETGCTDPGDAAGKGANYKVVQELAVEFKKRNGSMNCSELLARQKCLSNATGNEISSYQPQERTPEYYKKRPCKKMVESGAAIFGEFLARIKK